ncbi:hypothetical protein MTR67_002035, partial [Solanum verrucosum]
VKGLSSEESVVRNDLVHAPPDRINAISDGAAAAPKQSGGWGGSGSCAEIKFDSGCYKDQGLEVISECRDTLKNMASEMNEELDRQVPLMDETESKIDNATSDLKNTWMLGLRTQLTRIVLLSFDVPDLTSLFLFQLRSSRNFCIDIILLCVILRIAAYLYK